MREKRRREGRRREGWSRRRKKSEEKRCVCERENDGGEINEHYININNNINDTHFQTRDRRNDQYRLFYYD